MFRPRLAAAALAALLVATTAASAGTHRTRGIMRHSGAMPPHFTIKLPHRGNLTVALIRMRLTLKPGAHAPKRIRLRLARSWHEPRSVLVVGGVTRPRLRGRTVTATALVSIINRRSAVGSPARTPDENPGNVPFLIAVGFIYESGGHICGNGHLCESVDHDWLDTVDFVRQQPPPNDFVPFESTEKKIPQNQRTIIGRAGPPAPSEPPAKVLSDSVGLLKAAASGQLSNNDLTFIHTTIDPAWGVLPWQVYGAPDPSNQDELQFGMRAGPSSVLVNKVVVTLPQVVTSVTNAVVLPNFRVAPCTAAGRQDTCDFSAQPFNSNEGTIFDMKPLPAPGTVFRVQVFPQGQTGLVYFGAVPRQ